MYSQGTCHQQNVRVQYYSVKLYCNIKQRTSSVAAGWRAAPRCFNEKKCGFFFGFNAGPVVAEKTHTHPSTTEDYFLTCFNFVCAFKNKKPGPFLPATRPNPSLQSAFGFPGGKHISCILKVNRAFGAFFFQTGGEPNWLRIRGS